jgi:2,3-dihydroxybiphenyl 1,2-dioxygenase
VIFHGAAAASGAFAPGRPISGFVTGPLGMGHVVLHVPDAEALLPFYRDLLGFKVTDYGLQGIKLYFMHVNGRHHSFALVGSGRTGLHHFMVELGSIDDVGQAYDIAQLQDHRIAYTLGRHSNDYVISFYANTPSGFFVEYGFGGRVIDPAKWKPHETFDGPSFWGHERLHLEPELRQHMRDLRMDAAARGLRAPVAAHPKSGLPDIGT